MGKTVSSAQVSPGQAAFPSARPGDRDKGPVLRAYIKILSSGSQLGQLHKKTDMWENVLATLVDHRHGLRLR